MADKIMEESRLKFAFPEKCTVVKFDDTTFYRDYFNKLPEAKGVDFISVDNDKIAFITVLEMKEIVDGELYRIIKNVIQHTRLLMWKEETAWILKWHRK